LAGIEQRFTPAPARGLGIAPAAPTLPPPGPVEPTLGQLDTTFVGAAPRRSSAAAAPKRSAGRWPLWLLLGVAVVAGVGVWQQDRLRSVLPASQTTAALDRAEQALAEGRLQRDTRGDGARELFAAVTAIDPDNLRARDGL